VYEKVADMGIYVFAHSHTAPLLSLISSRNDLPPALDMLIVPTPSQLANVYGGVLRPHGDPGILRSLCPFQRIFPGIDSVTLTSHGRPRGTHDPSDDHVREFSV
jgi:hypothetical protein